MKEPMKFDEALSMSSDAKRYLLLGNGFSCALYPDIFAYKALLEKAFEKNSHMEKVFHKLDTQDFERVIRSLEEASNLLECYNNGHQVRGIRDTLKNDANELKASLVETISEKHPESSTKMEAAADACDDFLSKFSKVYTLNYDLLLYWVINRSLSWHKKELKKIEEEGIESEELVKRKKYHEKRKDNIDDGFRRRNSHLIFLQPNSANFFYLHGGFHLYTSGFRTRKLAYKDEHDGNGSQTIMKQVCQDIEKSNQYPLIVAEGKSSQKQNRIDNNSYLAIGQVSFGKVCNNANGNLFVFGHSLDSSDDHFLSMICEGAIKKLFVSVYEGKNGYDEELMSRASSFESRRKSKRQDAFPLEIHFFDAESANIWGKNKASGEQLF